MTQPNFAHNVQPTKKTFGSRPVGYSGHRRKQSYYDNVGRSSSNKVPTAVKQAIFDKTSSIEGLFKALDVNNDGIISKEEMLHGFGSMKLGLKDQQITSIYDELQRESKRADHKIDMKAFSAWLADVAKGFVVMNLPK